MDFARQSLLKPEIETQLAHEMLKHWRGGMLAKDIAGRLDFGKVGSPYEKLKIYHVYAYRIKFHKEPEKYGLSNRDFCRRRKPPRPKGEHRYKTMPEELGMMSAEKFVQILNDKLPKLPDSYHKEHEYKKMRQRAYLITHFWTPLRKSEIYERTIDDIKITDTKITFSLLRKKKSQIR